MTFRCRLQSTLIHLQQKEIFQKLIAFALQPNKKRLFSMSAIFQLTKMFLGIRQKNNSIKKTSRQMYAKIQTTLRYYVQNWSGNRWYIKQLIISDCNCNLLIFICNNGRSFLFRLLFLWGQN